MFYGCVGVFRGSIRDFGRSYYSLVALIQEKGTRGLEGLAFLDEAGISFHTIVLSS